MKEKLKKLIEKEDKKNPYTDEQISEFLQVSRELVTNLRNELNIPNSRGRRMSNLVDIVNSILEKDENISERDLTQKVNEKGFKVSRHTIRECKKEIGLQKRGSIKKTNENIDNSIQKENTNSIGLNKPEEGYKAFKNIIGSEGSLKPHIQLAKAAVLYPPHGLHTLILGATGVGKSELAAAMYEFAKESGTISKEMPFIIFNCADYADNPQLLMSQLFGYAKGAFTGAEEDKEGLVEKANESVIFLDEVHRLPAEGQELLFYIIDKGKFRRLGETDKERHVQVTIIAATTENPDSTLLATFRRRIPMIIELPTLSERPLNERLDIIKEFYRKEANRTQNSVKVKNEALGALLLYDCPGNIGQLRSDIQVSCARSFLNCVVNRGDVMEVSINELPLSAKKGLLKIRNNRKEMQELTGNVDIVIHPDNNPMKMTPYENLYILPNEIYGYIENRYNELNEQNINQEAINHIIGVEMEGKLEDLMNKVRRNTRPLEKKDLMKIVGPEIINVVEKIIKVARWRLGINADDLYYVLAAHLSTTIERVKQGKEAKNPQLDKIKRDYKEEFEVAKEMVAIIEKELNVELSEDEAGFITMYLRMTREEENKVEGRVGVILISHGNVASGMAEVANKLLGVNHVKAIEMALDEKPEMALERATEMAKIADEGKGVLLLVDMGSLVTFGELITKRTGIRTRSIARTDTLMVVEAVRRSILPDADLDEIADALEEEPKYITKVATRKGKDKNKPKVILTMCITGQGSAQKIKELIENLVNEYDESVNIIPIGAVYEDVNIIIENIEKTNEILAIIGTVDPKIDRIPYISLENIISGNIEEKIKEVLFDAKLDVKRGKKLKVVDILDSRTTIFNMKTSSKEETIKKLSELLSENNYVDESFFSSVVDRERIGSTNLTKGVAIPHGDPAGVIKPGIGLGILENEIDWDGQKTGVVALLAFDETCIELVREISDFFHEEGNYEKLKKSTEINEIIQLFRR